MPDAPDLLAAFEDYCERLADEAHRALEATRRDVALCSLPWPPTLRDVEPVRCQLPEGHDCCPSCTCTPAQCAAAPLKCCPDCAHDKHWHWTGGIDVVWGGRPYVLVDEQ